VDDAARLYADLLEAPDEPLAGRTFNAARENHTFSRLASIVCDVVQQELPEVGHIELETADAERTISYNLSADRLHRTLGWRPSKSVEDAVADLCRAFRDGKLPNPMSDPRYYNVKMIQSVGLV
jgi:nucleoside-diphosphate-sugar epimerase